MTISLTILFILITTLGMYLLVKLDIFKPLNNEPIRFCAVGAMNTWVYYLFFTILNLGLNYFYAHIIAFLISACFSFVLSSIYTFKVPMTLDRALKFPFSFLPNLIISSFGTVIVVENNLLSEDYASFIMMLVAIPITFVFTKFLIGQKK